MFSGAVLDTEASKNVAVVHKTNQGYSGKDLYRLKQERPELFANAGSAADEASGPVIPQGFKAVSNVPGWYYHQERNVYFQKETAKFLCRDEVTGEYYELKQGDNLSSILAVRGDAAASAGNGGGTGGRHVMIGDLHRAAGSMKLDLAHHDSPAAMFAIYDSRSSGSATTEAAAKGFHVRLLPRLAAYRGQWQDDRLKLALVDSMESLGMEIGCEGGISMAVALLLGRRLILAASRGCVCLLFGPAGMDAFNGGDLDVLSEQSPAAVEGPAPHAGTGATVSTGVVELDDIHLGIFLTVGAVCEAGISPARLRSLVRQHISQDRPRGSCIAALDAARRSGAKVPMVAAAVRLRWTQEDDEPVPKRLKTAGLTKVRCRHILLRHIGSHTAGDRRPKATRSVHEAEARMLSLLQEFMLGGTAAFTDQCKKLSECDSALKGGELCGDIGWLDKDPAKNRKVPAAVVRAAFQLAIGQFSDIVSSERGVHLLLRTA